MNKFLKILITTLLSLTFVLVIGCDCSNSEDDPPELTVVMSQTELNTVIGTKTSLKVENEDDFLDEVVWSTSNESVATVSEDGMVEAYSLGETTITATVGELKGECKVTVTLGSTLPQLVMDNERSEYRIGKDTTSFPFNAYVIYNGKKYDDATITYSSSDETVVKMDESGKSSFKAVGLGTAEIIMTATWRNITADTVPSLYKSVKITVLNDVYFYINGKQYADLKLYTVSDFYGQNYQNEMDFVPSVKFNGNASEDVEVILPSQLVEQDANKIRAIKYGEDKIIFNYNAPDGNVYSSSLDLTVERPIAQYAKKIKYFSAYTGTFKDDADGFKNKTLVKELFGEDTVENLNVYQGKTNLTVSDGKLLGVKGDRQDKYDTQFTFETDKVIFSVDATVYSIVVQCADDLKLFELKFTATDDPSTSKDETRITAIDGYCALINNVDASGIKINHEVIARQYDYTDGGQVKQRTVGVGLVEHIGPFGFLGNFDGNGYTISNLDLSVAANEVGGGLFGYAMGATVIEDLGLVNLNISNSSGLMHSSHAWKETTVLNGLNRGRPVLNNIYAHLSSSTVNPKGVLMNTILDAWSGYYDAANIVIDATEVSYDGHSAGSLLFNKETVNFAAWTTRKNIYVISDEHPVTFNGSTTLYGQNHANGAALDNSNVEKPYEPPLPSQVFASGIKSYASFEEMVADKNKYGDFSQAWYIAEYPIFKTAKEFLPVIDDEVSYDNTITLSSATNSKTLVLMATATGGNVTDVEYVYDQTKLVIDGENIKLKETVSAIEKTTITANYSFNGKSGSIVITVNMVPYEQTVSDEIELSAYLGNTDVFTSYMNGETIQEILQVIASDELPVTVDKDGKMLDLAVKVKSDYSGIETTGIKIVTRDIAYVFTNVKLYNHIITKGEDLKALELKPNAGRKTGYYILKNNVNANGVELTHSAITDEGVDVTETVFQGVFDGNGFAIYNFKPTMNGLFGSVYSDTADNGGKAVIKNLALMNVTTEQGKPFTALGRFVNSSANGVHVEVTNVHVEIAETFMVEEYADTANNFRGLFGSNSMKVNGKYDTFKLTNVYINVLEEPELLSVVKTSYGSILSSDYHGRIANKADRSSRFENVVTVTKLSPVVRRQFVGEVLATEFGESMYFIYAENDIGKVGLTHDAALTPHNPIDEDGAKGMYIYSNVYRYDSETQVDNEKAQLFTATGLWEIKDGALKWKNRAPSVNPSGDKGNFDVEWL